MDWKSFIKETRSKFANLNKELPNTFDGFNLMGKDAKKNGIVDEKTKEFVALGIAISTRCESCIGMHVEALVRLGVSKAEFDKDFDFEVRSAVVLHKYVKKAKNNFFDQSSRQN